MIHTFVWLGEISKFDIKKLSALGGLGGPAADVCMCLKGWSMCVCLGEGWWGVQNHQDNDHDSRLTHSPPAVLLSPSLRFGFSTRFELRQWFSIILCRTTLRAKRLLAAHSLVLLTSGQQRSSLLNLINQPPRSNTHRPHTCFYDQASDVLISSYSWNESTIADSGALKSLHTSALNGNPNAGLC